MYLAINKWVIAVKNSNFSGQYLHNHWTLDIDVLGYIGIVWPKEHSPEVWSVPPVTPCICLSEVKVSLRHKFLITSRSKKGTQIYYSFLSKVPANEPPPGSPKGPLWRGRHAYRAFCVPLKKPQISGSPVKGHSPKPPPRSPIPRAPYIQGYS